MIPRRIPGFELRGRLGGGPMNHVCLAWNRATDEPCVVKVLRSAAREDAVANTLLSLEGEIGLSLRHPHVVRILESSPQTRPAFLVMERLYGKTLREIVEHDHFLPIAEAVRVVRETAEGLAALHRSGWVHGDIKPENIHQSDDGHIKLIDLGFAHRPGEMARILKNGFVLGTANYLAPELCASQENDCFASDLFSLGMTLFELLSGHLPYPPGTPTETMESHRDEEPDELSQYGDYPGILSMLVHRLLSRDPVFRPTAESTVRQLVSVELVLRHRRAG